MPELSDRFRLVLPDLPLHGDSEDRPRHPYTPEWLAEVLAGFLADTCGPRPRVGGHEVGALLLLRAVVTRQLVPGRLVLMPSVMHRRPPSHRAARALLHAGAVPGLDRAVSHTARAGVPAGEGRAAVGALEPGGARPRAPRVRRRRRQRQPRAQLGARGPPLAGRLSRPARQLPADRAAGAAAVGRRGRGRTRVAIAEEALDLLPDAQLRVLPGTGFLMAYDDPVGLARELAAFCT